MQNALVLLLWMFLSCKTSSKPDVQNSGKALLKDDSSISFGYPDQVRVLGLEHLYDNTKWFLYCISCDRKLIFNPETNVQDTSTTFGMLPLTLDQVIVNNDTVEIDLLFRYKELAVNERLISFSPVWGAMYVGDSDSIILYSGRTTARYYKAFCRNSLNCENRAVVPLQPEVIKYITEHKDKIDPWFKMEVIKRG
ncbi:MAG TPA: hypothetical protein VL098_00685 [Flavipsychrobacter sp.]|nr:hypothetical protein [Flavipsychrobacter sp.]